MWIYAQLIRVVPKSVATLVVAIWFGFLVAATIFLANTPQADFLYSNI